MKRLLLVTTSIATPAALATSMFAALAAPAAAQDMFDWSGFYFGGGAGVLQSNNIDSIVYEDGGLLSGWTSDSGAFSGEIYRVVDSAGIVVSRLDLYDFAFDDYALSLEEIDDWSTEADSSATEFMGTVWAGGQWQMPGSSLVLGGELRGSFGSFGSTHTSSWSQVFQDDGEAECETSRRSCTVVTTLPHPLPLLPLVLLSPDWTGYDDLAGDSVSSGDIVTIEGEVRQTAALSIGTSFDKSFSALAKVGVAANRALIYAIAGPTVAEVTASTSLTLTEVGEIYIETDGDDDDAEYYGSKTYNWSGSVSEQRVGFTFGAGVDFAVTDNVILRGEASYTNMGRISVTGTSEDTNATYSVEQWIGAGQILAGISFLF